MGLVKGIKPLSPEWHKYRAKRISGTSVAGILGVSRFSTPLSEWARLTGKMDRPVVDSPFADWGIRTEPFNKAWYEEETGRLVLHEPGLFQHRSIDWLCFTPDGIIDPDFLVRPLPEGSPMEKGRGLWEAKAPSAFKAKDWDDKVPLEYQVQIQIGMEVLGLSWASVSALIQPHLKIVDVERNQRFIDACMERLDTFWSHNVLGDIPPEATGDAADKAALKGLAPSDPLPVTEALEREFAEFLKAQAEVKELEKDLDRRKNKLTQALGQPTWMDAKKALLAKGRETR